MPDLVLALGAVVALLAARLLAPRAPALLRGVGLVLLLVAALRPLGDAGELLSSPLADPPAAAVALAVGLAVGSALWLRSRGRPPWRGPVCAGAVVLGQAPLLAAFAVQLFDVPVDAHLTEPVSQSAGLLLAGLLAGGALAVLGPGLPTAIVAVAGLVGLLELSAAADPFLVRLLCAGPAAAVLVPALVEEAGLALQSAPGPRLGHGVLAGVALVVVASAVPPLLDTGMPRRYAAYEELRPGLAGALVLSNEEYGLFTAGGGPRLLPGLGLLRPGTGLLP